MNKLYLRQLFGHANSGYGYRYTGEIPAGADVPVYVTGRYVELTEDRNSATIVVWSTEFNCAVLYLPGDTENTTIASEFAVINDLTPPPAPETETETDGNVAPGSDSVGNVAPGLDSVGAPE